MQDVYTSAIDIWSVGCIFAELLSMMRDNIYDGQPLFPGASCFPLSPTITSISKEESHHNNDDQLAKIFEVIGTPEDLSFI